MSEIKSTSIIYENVKIGNNVVIHDYVVIYPNTVIEDDVEILDHAVIGRLPMAPKKTTKRKINDEYRETRIKKGSVISVGSVVYSGCTIGEYSLLGDNASLREDCVVGDRCIIARNVSVNYNTKIGNGTKIMDNTHITGNAIIGDNVFISVLVATTNDNSMGQGSYSDEREKGPWIKDGAKIGAAANILPGIVIGENAMVGAGSVVTKNVADGVLVMGIPARFVREI